MRDMFYKLEKKAHNTPILRLSRKLSLNAFVKINKDLDRPPSNATNTLY